MTDTADERVQIIGSHRGFEGFFRIDVHSLRYRRFDGSWSDIMEREVFERGAAAAVLPYDPTRDEIVLIRQFLPGFLFSGRDPFPLHIVAGMIGPGETPEDVARRETIEESGLSLEKRLMEKVASYLPSPGGSSEVIHVFVACVDTSHAGGYHGVPEEHEDIRVEVMRIENAIALLDSGVIEHGPALVALLWLARHRERLRRAWLSDAGRDLAP